jgi:beta-mannosidase
MRKAQYGFGWDWGPRLPTVGIWRPVELRRERVAALRGVRFATVRIGAGEAVVEVAADVERFQDAELRLEVQLGTTVATLPPEGGHLTVPDPVLWWTHDLGEPALYDLSVRLVSGEDVLDERASRVGIRTVELDQAPDPDEPGTRFFRFRLNGVPIFARGANWIPADSFVGGLEDERYERLIADAREANMNMLRVWGGGIYEHDVFYELCDREGLLVWQDFMFSCAMYPERELAREVEQEARYQVTRLASHPCLALWCGNNENQWIHDMQRPRDPVNRVPGARFYDDILPRAVAELSPATPYWPGSPYGGNDHNGREDGDVHNWEVWHGNHPRRFGEDSHREPTPESVSFARYAEDRGRFISEFGTLSAPGRETLRRWIPADQLYHHSAAMDHHTKDTPKNKIDMLLESVTGVAEDLDEFVDFSMIAQAEAMKFGIEHFRRRKPHCSGTLIWQLNDCWPVLSWALVDYHGFGKAAYHFVRRVYAPVLASFDGSELWITNDTAERVRDVARVRLGRFDGPPLEEHEVPIDVAPHASRRVGSFAFDGGPDRYLAVSSAAAAFPVNRRFFAAIKDLRRPAPNLEHSVEAIGGGRVVVRLRADAYAYFVHVAAPDERTRYSDNYIELEPGEERTITAGIPGGALRPEDVEVRAR